MAARKRPQDEGQETWQPALEELLDRHQAELFEELDRIDKKAARRHRALMASLEKIMATLDQVLETVSASDTKLDSVIALVDGLKQQVADALSGANLSPAVQAKVDAIFAKASSNAAKISDALDENVPVEPPVEPTP